MIWVCEFCGIDVAVKDFSKHKGHRLRGHKKEEKVEVQNVLED